MRKTSAAKADGTKAKSSVLEKATGKKATLHIKANPPTDSALINIDGMIATAAYFIAEHRGFTPGHDLEDWFTAEQQVRAKLVAPAAA
jgi:hypothetical protein